MICSKPRVLIVSHNLRLGGVERSLIGLLRALPPRTLDVDLLLLERDGELLDQVPKCVKILPAADELKSLSEPMRGAAIRGHGAIVAARLAARCVIWARRVLGLAPGFLLARSHRYAAPFLPYQPGEYDLAISFLMPHDYVAKRVVARRKAGWIHTDYTSVETGVAVEFEREAWARMDDIVAVSPEVAAAFAKVFPDLAPRLAVIENILDPSWVRMRAGELVPAELRAWPSSPTLNFCSVGRLTHQKGFDIAILAAERLRAAGLDFRWHIIGYGPDEAMLRKMIEERGLQEQFILMGPHENPYPFMRACDLYIQPSRYEGKAVAIREAQMLGKPTLVSDFSTVRSQIEHGVDGYIAPAGVDGLVDAILRLAADAQLRESLARTAAARDYGNLAEVHKVLALIPPQDA